MFGRIDQHTVALTTRVNYTITPQLSVQIYAAAVRLGRRLHDFKELVDGRAARYDDRYAPFDYAGNPDFNYRSFRTTNVLRWEYKPGSTLFVVWQQGRESTLDRGAFDFRRDFGGVFGAPATQRVPGEVELLDEFLTGLGIRHGIRVIAKAATESGRAREFRQTFQCTPRLTEGVAAGSTCSADRRSRIPTLRRSARSRDPISILDLRRQLRRADHARERAEAEDPAAQRPVVQTCSASATPPSG